MIKEISFIDSLVVSVFSMIVVFGTLIVIAAIIGGIKLLSSDSKKKEVVNVQSQASADNKNVIDVMETKENNGELVAVIVAAISANLRANSQDINIKTIKRVPQNLNP